MAQIIKRGENRWQVQVFRGRDANGKRRFHIKTVRGTKKAAQAYAREVEAALGAGEYLEPTKLSVAEFLHAWLAGTASQRLRPPTLASYKKLVENYVIPVLGDRRLLQLRLPEIDQLYATMKSNCLSSRTVRYTHSVLRSALNHAVKARLLMHNPTDHATLPRIDRKEMQSLSASEVLRFLAAAKADRWYALFDLLTMTGLRPGEALGLRRNDINGSTISVQRALVTGGENWVTAEPKTRRSRRLIPLCESTVRALQGLRRRQVEERLRAGSLYADSDFVFTTANGYPLDIKNLTHRHFRKVLSAAGLPHVRLYDLRHTAATLMLSAGVNPKVASERLGHSTITLTMDTYSHVLPDMQQDAVDRVTKLLSAVGQ